MEKRKTFLPDMASWLCPPLLFLPAILCCYHVLAAAPEADLDTIAFFETRIRPVFADNCFGCHGPRKQESGLRLDSLQAVLDGGKFGHAVVPGKPDKTLLSLAVRHEDVLRMPPDRKLAHRQINDLVRWVESGAPWPNANGVARERKNSSGTPAPSSKDRAHWAFQKLVPATPPP